MKKIKVTIEKNNDGFHAHATNVPSVSGYGETIEECKKNVFEGIEVAKTLEGPYKFTYTDYEVVFNFDVQSLIENYKGILSNAAFERLTGINQKQIQHYSAGLTKPRTEQKKKIEAGLHRLGQELMAIEL